jgi:adenine-specific DNA-methyltransferase
VVNLKKLPIYNINFENDKDVLLQNRIIELVKLILDSKRHDPTTDTSSLEAEIDQCVYALYELDDEEVNLVEKS